MGKQREQTGLFVSLNIEYKININFYAVITPSNQISVDGSTLTGNRSRPTMTTDAIQPNWLTQLRMRLAELSSLAPSPELGAGVLNTLTAIQRILSEHRKEMPPDLVHFLERRSYEKAAQYCAGALVRRKETCGARN